jgi:hypothetical protein
MDVNTEVASPASNSGDGEKSSNVSSGQAAAYLFAKSQTPSPAPEPTAVEDEAPGEPEKTEPSTAEVETSPADTLSEESAPAEAEQAPAEEEAEDEEEGVLSHKSPLDKKLREEIQERINREVSKRKNLEEKVMELEAEVRRKDEAKASPAPQGPLPLSEFNDLASLEKHGESAKQAARWARDQLDRDDFTEEGVQIGGEVYDKPRLKAIVRAAEVALEDDIPARKTFLRQRAEMSRQAVTLFPFLQDKSSPDYQLAVAAYRENPWLRDRPNADYIVGLVIEGRKAVEARAAAKAAPAKPKVAPVAKPAGDQTAVSSGATTSSRSSPGSAARAAFAAERGEAMKKGAISASEAVAFLLHREKSTKR